MLKFDNFTATQDFARNAASDRDRLLVQLLTTMNDRIVQLEEQLQPVFPETFDERVLEVLDVRSGSAREALGLDDADVERWILATIEENSGTVFSHIEAEIEEKLEGFLDSNSFNEAISDAVKTVSGLSSTVEEILDGLLHDAIVDAIGDAEDIVRKGLRSIL
jgi:hypothetical protein